MKAIVVTGFAPFGEETENPSWQAVSQLPESLEGCRIHTLPLPTAFTTAGDILLKTVEEISPQAVLCVGQAGGRATLTLEKVAINLQEASIPDNAGVQPRHKIICPQGADGYFSSLPLLGICHTLRTSGIPIHLSYSAGTYVCNDVMYRLLHFIHTQQPSLLGGFLHVPYTPQQTLHKPFDTPSVPLGDTLRGLELTLSAILRYGEEDLSPSARKQ